MVRIPKYREPAHPGEMLLEEFLIPLSITQRDLAAAIHVPYQRIAVWPRYETAPKIMFIAAISMPSAGLTSNSHARAL